MISRKLLRLAIRWIEIVTSMLLYVAENAPKDMRADLHIACHDLTDEIKNTYDIRPGKG
jgi:hypothetical protein